MDTAPKAAVAWWRLLLSWLESASRRSVIWVFLVDVGMMVGFGALSQDWSFVSIQNLQFLGQDAAESIILAVGISVVLSCGEIDISLGANLILSSVVAAKVMLLTQASGATRAVLLGLAACLATGLVFGLINGLIVVCLRVNSLIATLATLGIGTGTALVITDSGDLFGMPRSMEDRFGIAKIAGVPLPFILSLVIALVVWIAMSQTRFGVRTIAMGSSRPAAERSGISSTHHILAVLGLMGLLAGIVGFIDVARFDSTNVGGHTTDALPAIAGAIIGGTGLFGGIISVWGAVMGALLSVILLSGLIIVGASAAYQQIAVGVILIVAVSLDQLRKVRETR